jgi:transcriptional regulator GlxA family with amidase domain
LPWTQRGSEPPLAHPERDTGRPSLDPSQIKQKLRIAKKELGDVTSAALAEHLGVSERTLNRWQKLAG